MLLGQLQLKLYVNTWGDNDVILSTVLAVAIL